ncbi:TadE family type IV pilus minor pilin [Jiangella mangrovi]|uniref:Flp pilus assembly protein TadG n=1 Tax=Jiangella mangrovi TaxID=1524084 RepID=A0A7W9GPU1_9ACTN|nr:TadE family type IV pilus minor pilin [Jiangella mangrovi]MBB5787598.1 Flp pilus assembly protein TadG [Jiangella mangrovi]
MRRLRPAARGDPQRGMVTAELAAAFPALVLVLIMAVWAITIAAGQLRCTDAAREAARAASRGEDLSVVQQVAAEAAPEGAAVDLVEVDGTLEVRVSARMAMPGPLGDTLPALTVSGRSVALAEGG